MNNEKQKLIFLKGMSGSGKSTEAKEMLQHNPNLRRVNKDELRLELFPEGYNRKKENVVVQTERERVREYLENGHDVVVDNTHLNIVHQRAYKKIAKEFDAEFIINDKFLDVPLHTCIERDALRENPVGEKVIRKQFNEYVLPEKQAKLYSPELQPLYILDFDGTLTLGPRNRSPYEWHKVGNDLPRLGLTHIVDAINNMPYAKVFILSGRDEVCRPESEEWLRHYCIDYDELYMRPSDRVDEKGNQVGDEVIKREMYEKYIKGKYNVMGVFDDRPKIVKLWAEELYLPVFAIGDQHMEF